MSMLVVSLVSAEATITVGPDGTWPTLAQGITAAGSPPMEEIRVQAGVTLSENLTIDVGEYGFLEISGGWDATFASRTDDPTLTVIDGGGGQVLSATVGNDGVFFLQNLTVQNGGGVEQGGGVRVSAVDAGDIGIYDCDFVGNQVVSGDSAGSGGALYLDIVSANIEVTGSRFVGNSATVPFPLPASTQVSGGSVYALVRGTSSLYFDSNLVQSSLCSCPTFEEGSATGCGVFIELQNSSAASIKRNTVLDSSTSGFAVVEGVAGWITSTSSTEGLLAMNRWQGATASNTPYLYWSMLYLIPSVDGSSLTQRGSLITDSDKAGLIVKCWGASTWQGANLTVAGNMGDGIKVYDMNSMALQRLYNSISFGNSGQNLMEAGSAAVEQGNNLIGVDPSFISPGRGDYQLRSGSLALDAGTPSPPGGLEGVDLRGNPRVQAGAVDIGAYEGVGYLFKDGFESAGTGIWSSAWPAAP